jgi:hypothetical protein
MTNSTALAGGIPELLEKHPASSEEAFNAFKA